ncbi:MAG: hypothetical protein ACYC4Q_07220 [Victivallaceae bacterium]
MQTIEGMSLFRQDLIYKSLSNLEKYGIPMLANDNAPVITGDDPGIYYFIPKLAQIFNISVPTSIQLFFVGLLILSSIAAGIGFFRLFNSNVVRFCAVIMLLAFIRRGFYVTDVYQAPAIAVIGIIPLGLYAFNRGGMRIQIAMLIWAGLLCSLCNQVRTHSGTLGIIFLIACIVINCWNKEKVFRNILLRIAILAIACCPAWGIMEYQIKQRNDFLVQRGVNAYELVSRHFLWHNMYIGLGWLPNQYGIIWNDSCAENKVISGAPGVKIGSVGYELELRKHYFELAKKDPVFIIKTYFSKAVYLSNLHWPMIILPLIVLVFSPYRHEHLFYLAIFFPMLAGFTMGLISIPKEYPYSMGGATAALLFCFLVFADYMNCRFQNPDNYFGIVRLWLKNKWFTIKQP